MDSVTQSIRDSYQIIDEYVSVDSERKAYVIKDDQGFKVTCYKLNEARVMIMDRIINLPTHSLYYAQDTAENWITYIINR